jgi:hypothetical protein
LAVACLLMRARSRLRTFGGRGARVPGIRFRQIAHGLRSVGEHRAGLRTSFGCRAHPLEQIHLWQSTLEPARNAKNVMAITAFGREPI